MGSEVFLSVYVWHNRHVERNLLTLSLILWKKKCERRRLSMLFCGGWLPRCASSMASDCREVGNTIRSDFKMIPLPVTVSSERIVVNFFNSSGESLAIQDLDL